MISNPCSYKNQEAHTKATAILHKYKVANFEGLNIDILNELRDCIHNSSASRFNDNMYSIYVLKQPQQSDPTTSTALEYNVAESFWHFLHEESNFQSPSCFQQTQDFLQGLEGSLEEKLCKISYGSLNVIQHRISKKPCCVEMFANLRQNYYSN